VFFVYPRRAHSQKKPYGFLKKSLNFLEKFFKHFVFSSPRGRTNFEQNSKFEKFFREFHSRLNSYKIDGKFSRWSIVKTKSKHQNDVNTK